MTKKKETTTEKSPKTPNPPLQSEPASSPGSTDIKPDPAVGSTVSQLKEEHQQAQEERREKRAYKKRKTATGPATPEDQEKRDKFINGLGLFSSMLLTIVCKRLPNPIPPTPEEVQVWNEGVTAVASKYFPLISNWDAELSLVLAGVIIFAPRLGTPEGQEEEKESGKSLSTPKV